MILIDSSVWIEFFRGHAPVLDQLIVLLRRRHAWAPECVFAELLQGAKREEDRAMIHGMWETLPRLESESLLLKAGDTSGRLRWSDRGIGLIDAWIILTARAAGSKIWSLDKKLNAAVESAEIFSP